MSTSHAFLEWIFRPVPPLPDPMHTLGVLPVTGMHAGILWVEVFLELAGPVPPWYHTELHQFTLLPSFDSAKFLALTLPQFLP